MIVPSTRSTSPAKLPPPRPIAEAMEMVLQEQAQQALESVELSTSISEHFGALSDPRQGGWWSIG